MYKMIRREKKKLCLSKYSIYPVCTEVFASLLLFHGAHTTTLAHAVLPIYDQSTTAGKAHQPIILDIVFGMHKYICQQGVLCYNGLFGVLSCSSGMLKSLSAVIVFVARLLHANLLLFRYGFNLDDILVYIIYLLEKDDY
ncbi:hypothetical protein ACJX0J_038663 [Zea mays]